MSSNRDLLRFLQENNESWITAKTLAMKLGVSERTVKSKISQLRKSGSKIASGPKGYRVKGTLSSTPNTTNYLPHNIKQRKSWLIRKLLKTENKVNVYDLSAQLYINDVELRKELKDLTGILNNYDLNLKHSGDFFKVDGKEENKRRLLSSIIYHELNGTLLNEKIIQKYFPEVNVTVISQILSKNLKESAIKLDSFNFSNILLHIVIMVDRTNNNKLSTSKVKKASSPAVQGIVLDLKTKLNYRLTDYDVDQLTKMLELLEDKHEVKIPDNLQINQLFKQIVDFVRRTYDLNLDEELFKKRFLPHLLRLIDRFKNNNPIHNPLAENIKNSSPTIYECATLIAYAIKDYLGISVSEEEIAFIALHVGNIVAEQIRDENKVICQLFMSDYHDNAKATMNLLDRRFGNDIVILNTISDESDILLETELIIVVNSKEIINERNFVQVSGFLLPNDINKIQKAVKQIKDDNLSQELKKGLAKFTSEKNFVRDVHNRSAREVIHYISEKFIAEKIVGNNFEDKIIEREKLSSTAFGSVAIPHTIDYNAKISQWFIYLNPKGIYWSGQTVYLIIVLASSSKDEKKFRKVFDELSEVIINDNKVSKLTSCHNYQEFVKEIIKIE